MRYIYLKDGSKVKVDDTDYERLLKYKWYKGSKEGYAKRSNYKYLGKGKYQTGYILMHRELLGAKKGEEVDHINRDNLDNRKENLRLCSRRMNCLNRGLQSNNTSGEKCIYWDKGKNRWLVQIKVNGRNNFVGRFIELESAVLAREDYLQKIKL